MKFTRNPHRDSVTVEVSNQLLAYSEENPGAFLRALKQEMEAAMNEYSNTAWTSSSPVQDWKPTSGIVSGGIVSAPSSHHYGVLSVEDAERALKQSKKVEKQQRKARKQANRAARERQRNHDIAIEALREVARDDRKYSADARVEAAKELLARSL